MKRGRASILAAVAIAGAALAVLFVKTRAIDVSTHSRFTNGLRAMAHRDDRVNQVVLKSREGLVSSFDPLVREWAGLSQLRASLTMIPRGLSAIEQSELHDRIKAMDERLAQKHALTDRFKSEQAILRNSLSYFPVIASELRDGARTAGAALLADRCDALLLAVLRFHAGMSDEVAHDIDAAVDACEAARNSLPEGERGRLDLVLNHARTIRKYREATDTTTRAIVMMPTANSIELVLAAYDRAFAGVQHRAQVFRNLLFALAVLLVGWGVWSLVQIRSSARQLRRANETLEDRVEERTAALRRTLGELDQEILDRTKAENELREARDLAEQHTQAKSQFLANMSHELRTPLNAIIGYSELLKEDAEDQELTEFVPDLEKIRTAGKHLLELINGVLDLSKIEAGKMELFLEEFDAAKLIGDVATVAQPLVEKNRNRLVIEGVESVGPITSDQTKLRQILFNLLSNACKFTEDGEIRLRCARVAGEEGERIEISVSDQGIGMNEEQVSKVFQAFTQADASTTRKFGGTGLGLTITREFCHMMGGTIDLESTPGVGTTFTVRLPALAKPEAPADPTELPLDAGDGRLVLAVDDDEHALEVVERYLKRHGFRVLCASNGADALALARQHHPDAITLDVMMPGMDGWQVMLALKNDPATADIPVVILSVAHEPALAYSLGATAYLTKPIDRARLFSVVDDALGEKDAPSILVVDDDEAVRDTTRRFLEQRGCAVELAPNGRAGLERALAETPDLVLLDLMMPEMDGFEFLERLRTAPSGYDVPVVVLTAKTLTSEDRARLNGRVEAILQRSEDQTPDALLGDALSRIRTAMKV